jgi:hypothetical protein
METQPMNWAKLTALTQGAPFTVERVRLVESQVVVEGAFELPPLAQLSIEDQVFVAAFVRSHGSIKEMERLFGVSYPTIKSRLARLTESLGPAVGVETNPAPHPSDILDRLERGEITAAEAAELLAK